LKQTAGKQKRPRPRMRFGRLFCTSTQTLPGNINSNAYSFKSEIQGPSTNGMDHDEDEKDGVQFSDQLQAIGLFGRFVVSHSIPLLTNLLTFKCQAFQTQLQATAAGVPGAKELLTIIYEDIHWILLIAGYTITFEGVGETNLIPSEVISLAINSASNKDQSLAALQASLNMQVTGEESVDPVVK